MAGFTTLKHKLLAVLLESADAASVKPEAEKIGAEGLKAISPLVVIEQETFAPLLELEASERSDRLLRLTRTVCTEVLGCIETLDTLTASAFLTNFVALPLSLAFNGTDSFEGACRVLDEVLVWLGSFPSELQFHVLYEFALEACKGAAFAMIALESEDLQKHLLYACAGGKPVTQLSSSLSLGCAKASLGGFASANKVFAKLANFPVFEYVPIDISKAVFFLTKVGAWEQAKAVFACVDNFERLPASHLAEYLLFALSVKNESDAAKARVFFEFLIQLDMANFDFDPVESRELCHDTAGIEPTSALAELWPVLTEVAQFCLSMFENAGYDQANVVKDRLFCAPVVAKCILSGALLAFLFHYDLLFEQSPSKPARKVLAKLSKAVREYLEYVQLIYIRSRRDIILTELFGASPGQPANQLSKFWPTMLLVVSLNASFRPHRQKSSLCPLLASKITV
ncbi:MAG: hypothetical protein MHM6MM_001146 [Cercozoa sp. M6MM]